MIAQAEESRAIAAELALIRRFERLHPTALA